MDIKPINLPLEQQKLMETIQDKVGGNYGGCWDLFLWKGKKNLFVEVKSKKDHIRESQIKWLDASLEIGLSPNDFILVVWDVK